MRENILADMSMDFSVDTIRFCGSVKGHYALINQLERSATSIGANIHEANYAQSKADFISKLQIALKECYESEYWLIVFGRSGIANQDVIKPLQDKCGTIRRILVSSINTTKRNLEKSL